MNIEEDSAQINVLVGEASKIAVGVQPSQKIDVIVGDAAKMDCTRAINYIKSGTAEIDKAVEEGIEDFNANAVAKTNAFNTNATNKTKDFNDNYSDKLSDFNDNYVDKKQIIDDAVSDAQGYATSASNSADLAKQWAIGDPSEPVGYSSKYWANEASSTVSNMANKDLSNLSATGDAKFTAVETNAKNYADSLSVNYATAAQGALADTALQPNDNVSELVNDAGYITSSALTNYVTTNTAQDISGRKTFLGEKAIYFKQSASSNKLGFTLYNTSSTEIGAFEYRPNTIGSGALLNVNCSSTGGNYVGFRYWGPNVNIVAPKVATAGTYYIPVKVTDGNTTVTASSVGTVDISSLLPTVNNSTITITQGGVTKGSFTLNQASGDTIALDAGASVDWGDIGGTLADQTDLNTALGNKANTDASNFTATGKATIAELPMPSDSYVALTPVASGSLLVTAPANGYVYLEGTSVASTAYCSLVVNNIYAQISWCTAGVTNGLCAFVPVRKGADVYMGAYNFAATYCKFIYAEGEI